MNRFLSAILALAAFACPALAQPPAPVTAPKPELELRDHIKASYTKYEYMIPMRDGARLFTAVYVPKDDSQTYPFMLIRTPYSCQPYGVDKYPTDLRPGEKYARSGYIFVYQD